MKPRITVFTLGVDNLEKSVEFYRDGLGLTTEGIIGKEFEYGAVAFFNLQSGLKFPLFFYYLIRAHVSPDFFEENIHAWGPPI